MIPRYEIDDISYVWSEKHQYQVWLNIERSYFSFLGQTQSDSKGMKKVYDKLVQLSLNPKKLDKFVELCHKKEKVTKHDIGAFILALEDEISIKKYPLARFIHHGLTSSDIKDTAFVVANKESLTFTIDNLQELLETITIIIQKYKNTLILGRTHGVIAEPTTVGLKFSNYYTELQHIFLQFNNLLNFTSVGKLSGAVGNYIHVHPVVEKKALLNIGIWPSYSTSQIIPRERFAEIIFYLSLLGSSLEKIATDIRLLHSTGEIMEGFKEGQIGSSTMPHKENPIVCENICGLARILRGHVQGALENVVLWNERDMTHSSVERIIFPDSYHIINFILLRMKDVIESLRFDELGMKEKIENRKTQWLQQEIMLIGIENGKSRSQAKTPAWEAYKRGHAFDYNRITKYVDFILDKKGIK